jgi:hypothetical protein
MNSIIAENILKGYRAHAMGWFEARVRVEELVAQDMHKLARRPLPDWVPYDYSALLLSGVDAREWGGCWSCSLTSRGHRKCPRCGADKWNPLA